MPGTKHVPRWGALEGCMARWRPMRLPGTLLHMHMPPDN